MSSQNVIETDILVIGGGLSGLMAAIKAKESGQNVIVVEKAYAGKSGGGALGASWFAVFNPDWGHDLNRWINFITKMGEYINNREWIKVILTDSYMRYRDFISWGIPFASQEGRSPVPGCSYALPLVKRVFMTMLRDKVIGSGVNIFDRLMVTKLLQSGNKVIGAAGFDCRKGDFYVFKSKATVLATGSGTFKLPGWMDHYWTSDGEALGYRAGAEITGKEFGGKDAGLLKDFALARAGLLGGYGNFINALGESYFTKYSPGNHTEHRRMMYSLFEVHAGNAPVYVNFENASIQQKKDALAAIKRSKFDWLAEKVGFNVEAVGKVEITFGSWVGYQGSIGGLLVDTDCRTSVDGLFAAGDCAGTRMCGSFYSPMGYGLAGAAVTGYRAGESAAKYARQSGTPVFDEEQINDAKAFTFAPLGRKGGFSPAYITQTLRALMAPYYVMQIKHGNRLAAALTFIEFIRDNLIPKIKIDDFHGLRLAHEVVSMTLNAEMILRASLFRAESRGSHYREDYPRRCDPEWLAYTVIRQADNGMQLYKRPIPAEWMPDMKIKYEERYEMRFPGEQDFSG